MASGTTGAGNVGMWNVEKIMEILPHRYPMLLVDRILEIEPLKRSVGIKNVTINEAFFVGHYPGMPVMPGVLIIESMAQVGACMVLTAEGQEGKVPLIAGIDGVKFRRPVVPGDQLYIEAEVVWFRAGMGKIKCRASVDGNLAAECEVSCKLVEGER